MIYNYAVYCCAEYSCPPLITHPGFLNLDRGIIASLFEDWLQSGKSWHSSTTYLNTKRSRHEKKRGAHVMRNKAWLVEKYGEPAANIVIENKKQLQSQRASEFDPCWVMRNPDLPDSEDTWLFLLQKIYNI